MEQLFEAKNGGFGRLMDFLFKDYPAWLWNKPNIFKFLIFPFLLFYKIFDILVSERGEKRFFYSRVYVASFLSVILFVMIFSVIDISKVQSQELPFQASVTSPQLTGDVPNKQTTIKQNNDNLTQNYILAGFFGCLIVIIWILVFVKRKNCNVQKCSTNVGQNNKSNYNK